jgi:DNA polymerase-3 subunit delta
MPQATVKPVYVLVGDEEYLRDSHRRSIVAQAVGEGDPQMCVTSFDATAPLTDVLDELRTPPFLAGRRVVIVEDADALLSAKKDTDEPEPSEDKARPRGKPPPTNRELLERYLANPSATGTLILMARSFASTTRLHKAVRKIGQIIDCNLSEEQDLSAWIHEAAQGRGKKIDEDAAGLLGQWVGRDLAGLDAQIEKLCLYALDRPSITEADVAALVAATAGAGAFELTNCITAGDTAAALRALGGSVTKRGEEFRTLGMIAWHLRRALTAQQAIKSGTRPEQALPRMPFEQRGAFLAMLKRRSIGKLLGDFRRMIRADLNMKSGAEPMAALQELVVELCR